MISLIKCFCYLLNHGFLITFSLPSLQDKCYDWSTKVEPKNQKAHEKLLLKLIHQEEEMKEKVKEMKRKEEEMKERLELLKSAPSLYVCLWEFAGEGRKEGEEVKVEAGNFSFFHFSIFLFFFLISLFLFSKKKIRRPCLSN